MVSDKGDISRFRHIRDALDNQTQHQDHRPGNQTPIAAKHGTVRRFHVVEAEDDSRTRRAKDLVKGRVYRQDQWVVGQGTHDPPRKRLPRAVDAAVKGVEGDVPTSRGHVDVQQHIRRHAAVRLAHGEVTADKHRVGEREEKGPADKGALPAVEELEVQDVAHADGHEELAKIEPERGEAARPQVEEVGVEVVGLVRDVPETGEGVGEEEDDQRLAG